MICCVYRRGRLYWGKLQLDNEPRLSRFSLATTDKRVAQAKLFARLAEAEKEAAGNLSSRSVREAAGKPLSDLLSFFLDDLKTQGRAETTRDTYDKILSKLFVRCRWRVLPDITVRSFCEWRARCGLSRKTCNDLLGAANSFFRWLVFQGLAESNPLEHVQRVDTRGSEQTSYRRSLLPGEVAKLLSVAEPHRRIVYAVALYTGLRRTEMMGLQWRDVVMEGPDKHVMARASLAGNKARKDARIPLHPQLEVMLRNFRPVDAAPFSLILAGLVPRLPRFRKDLVAAGIPFLDSLGRRADLHALRDTFITELVLAGNPPEVVMKLARHSDLRVTMRFYVDSARLPLAQGLAKLPAYTLAEVCPETCPNVGLGQSEGVAS